MPGRVVGTSRDCQSLPSDSRSGSGRHLCEEAKAFWRLPQPRRASTDNRESLIPYPLPQAVTAMFRTVFSLLGFLSALPLHTQDGIAAGSEDRAAELRQLLRDTPRLPLEPVPLASRLLRAAALGNSDPPLIPRNLLILQNATIIRNN